MNRWRQVGFGAAVAFVVVAGVTASVIVGAAEPATERAPSAPLAVTSLGSVASQGPASSAPPEPNASDPDAPRTDDVVPRYPGVTRTAAQLAGGGVDLYLPMAESGGHPPRRFPLALLVADPSTDPGQYDQLAHDLGTYGVAVVVSGGRATDALRAANAWATKVRANPSEYLSDKLQRSVSFVVLTGAARAPDAGASRVVAQVRVAPTGGGIATSARVPTLSVCSTKPSVPRACTAKRAKGARLTIADSDALSITDEGRRTPRGSEVVEPERLRAIAAFARPTALWLLAKQGVSGARVEITRMLAAG